MSSIKFSLDHCFRIQVDSLVNVLLTKTPAPGVLSDRYGALRAVSMQMSSPAVLIARWLDKVSLYLSPFFLILTPFLSLYSSLFPSFLFGHPLLVLIFPYAHPYSPTFYVGHPYPLLFRSFHCSHPALFHSVILILWLFLLVIRILYFYVVLIVLILRFFFWSSLFSFFFFWSSYPDLFRIFHCAHHYHPAFSFGHPYPVLFRIFHCAHSYPPAFSYGYLNPLLCRNFTVLILLFCILFIPKSFLSFNFSRLIIPIIFISSIFFLWVILILFFSHILRLILILLILLKSSTLPFLILIPSCSHFLSWSS